MDLGGKKENNRLALRCSINILEFDLHSSLGSTHSSCVRLTNYLTSLSCNVLGSTIRHIIPALLFCSVIEGCKWVYWILGNSIIVISLHQPQDSTKVAFTWNVVTWRSWVFLSPLEEHNYIGNCSSFAVSLESTNLSWMKPWCKYAPTEE